MNPPAGIGGDGLCGPVARISVLAAADDERRHAAFLRRQLQAPALRKIERAHLADHGGEALAAQSLLQRPERVVVAACFEMQQARWIAAAAGQGAGIKIALPRNPQSLARAACLCAAEQPRTHRGGQARLLEIETGAGKFMQAPEPKSAARQMIIDGGNAPIDHRCSPLQFRRQAPLQQGNPPPQRAQPGPVRFGAIGFRAIETGWKRGQSVHYSLFVLAWIRVKQ